MNLDNRINPDIIKSKLLEIFNNHASSGDNYTVEIMPEFGTYFEVKNNGKECYLLNMPELNNGKYIITGGVNQKCSDGKGSGTKNLKNIIIFGIENGYDLFKLTDVSTLYFEDYQDKYIHKISMSLFKLLTIGNTWYSQFGFENKNTIIFKTHILLYINQTFSDLIKNIFILIDTDTDSSSSSNKESIKKYIQDEVNSYILKCNNFPNFSKSINIESTEIKDCFLKLVDYLLTICPNYKCPDEINRDNIKIIENFMYFVFYIILCVINNTTNITTQIKLIENNYNNIKRLVNKNLDNFSNLSLNLKPEPITFIDDNTDNTEKIIKEIDGGKSRKYQKSIKRRVTKRKFSSNKKRKQFNNKY